MKKLSILFLIYILIPIPGWAVHVKRLYQGILPVTSQSAPEREQAASKALSQVLVKVSGNSDILNNPAVKTRLNNANSLMQEFSYAPTPYPDIAKTKPYLLQLNFDPEGVNSILRDAKAPLWGQNRPLLLIWLASEIPNHPAEVIGANSSSNLPLLLKENTDQRGLPIIFPAMDVEDLSQISVNDIANPNFPKLITAAKRYASDGILVGTIKTAGNNYVTEWRLILGNDQWGWNITGQTLPEIFSTVTDRVALTLSGRYATVITNAIQAQFDLQITNVSEADDFVQVMNYIKHLTPVSDVQLTQISGSNLYLKISLRGSQESFTQALSVGQKLTAVPSDGKQPMLIYQWNH